MLTAAVCVHSDRTNEGGADDHKPALGRSNLRHLITTSVFCGTIRQRTWHRVAVLLSPVFFLIPLLIILIWFLEVKPDNVSNVTREQQTYIHDAAEKQQILTDMEGIRNK